jgi:N-methylhydantoinase A/oxoprolinase/acetone carboxylase beta subunit
MLLGLDVGGTHTDVVIIGKDGIVASSKVITKHDDLLSSINEAFENVFSDVDIQGIDRINLSTTLSTNAIVENKIENVGVFVSSGPGVNPENYRIGDHFYVIDGSIDHRGSEILAIDEKRLEEPIGDCKKSGIRVFSVVTKFSTRNPSSEHLIGDRIGDISDFTTLGHMLSGQLNFPRRIATAYYNSAVWRLYNEFVSAIERTIQGYGVKARISILKADGGTMPLSISTLVPVESILSGPAASVMGIIALCKITEDSIILDIGGTTTDIAIFASGAPLIEDGISLNSHLTLVRALKTKSIGIGGDSLIRVKGDAVTVGPDRAGPAMAAGGKEPTLIDALNFRDIIDYNDREASKRGIIELSKKHGMEPDTLAERSIRFAVTMIRSEVNALIDEINEKPVYTVHEILEGKIIEPSKLYIMGGPASAFSGLLADEFGFDVVVPENYSIANAIGAALTRPTMEIELFADTEKRRLLVPNLNIDQKVDVSYTLADARDDARNFLTEFVTGLGMNRNDVDCEITEAVSFNMISGYGSSSGRNIRVKCQIKPGITNKFRFYR